MEPTQSNKKKPNELGIYDMTGNVGEWCQDWHGKYSSKVQINPIGPSSGTDHIIRGGSWGDVDRCCRISYRDYNDSHFYDISLGLRLALSE